MGGVSSGHAPVNSIREAKNDKIQNLQLLVPLGVTLQ